MNTKAREDWDRVRSTLVSVMKARSPHDPKIRRIVIDHCAAGGAMVMTEATAEYLIDDGLARSILPVPTNPITTELAERAVAAVWQIIRDYQDQGGVLLARRFIDSTTLCDLMLKRWTSMELPRIAGTENLPEYEKQHERIARAAVSAQMLKILLDKKHLYTKPGSSERESGHGYFIQHTKVEAFCMTAVKIMEYAYRAPDEWVAQKLNHPETLMEWIEKHFREKEAEDV